MDSDNEYAGYRPVIAYEGMEFTRPVDFQYSGGTNGHIFIVEQRGKIYVLNNQKKTLFLDIEDQVDNRGNEEGLLGLAFHPNYANNGYFYVNYTANNPDRTVIARFSVDPSSPLKTKPNSKKVLLEFSQPYSNHNGGSIVFGPDGYLYIGVGDGGSGGDPQGNGQNVKTLLGSILRIDVNKNSVNNAYGIPADNPFASGQNGAKPEIYAYGLRNPWRINFDSETGDLWAGDVGQNAYEEIDIIKKGGNYGWKVREGEHCYSPQSGCETQGFEPPVWEYGRGQGLSVTGGFVYRGTKLPGLIGKYIYADYLSGRVWALEQRTGKKPENTLLFKIPQLQVASFGVDQNQELYICSFDGHIYRLEEG
ncbi:MAG: PQQ-dependent sugar dehydrogenase [Bacteroidetes bacterium]|nr:PQQ-dependent sugar dehydrogenase [Bacteroidota bacterium]